MIKCRHCSTELTQVFCDLQHSPPSNSFLTKEELDLPEVHFPLKVYVCGQCRLVQVPEHKKSSEIFDRSYVYFSSMSSSWVQHAKDYVEMMTSKLSLNKQSHVIEIASNDGYLLQFFVEKGIPCLGIEPSTSTSEAARSRGVPVLEEFFGVNLAQQLTENNQQADLVIGNNVLAHVPDINDFARGLRTALKPRGTVTMEFPHLVSLVAENQFDTIYHEHFSYLSLTVVSTIFEAAGLFVYDVEKLKTHGGSLRVYAARREAEFARTNRCEALFKEEHDLGLHTDEYYQGFQVRVDQVRHDLLSFLLEASQKGQKVAAYGAAAKGNTLLNYCGVRSGLIDYVVDKAPLKMGKYLPGSHIPVYSPEKLSQNPPHYVLILPWNLREEIVSQVSALPHWKGRFVCAIPRLQVL